MQCWRRLASNEMPRSINIERMEVVVDVGHCQLVVANELRHLPAYKNGMVQLRTKLGYMPMPLARGRDPVVF